MKVAELIGETPFVFGIVETVGLDQFTDHNNMIGLILGVNPKPFSITVLYEDRTLITYYISEIQFATVHNPLFLKMSPEDEIPVKYQEMVETILDLDVFPTLVCGADLKLYEATSFKFRKD